MKYWDSATRSNAASSPPLSARYWGLRSSRGTFTVANSTRSSIRRAHLTEVGDPGLLRRVGLVVLEVPVHEPPDANFHRRRRLVPHIAHQVFDVGIGVGHIARLQGQQILDGLPAKAVLEHLDIARQID